MAPKYYGLEALFFMAKTLFPKRANQFSLQKKVVKPNKLLHKISSGLLPDGKQALVFQMEGALLKSSSIFPYFMLVAFEAGGLLRALILFLLYPFVCLAGEDLGMKVMVFVCFVGIKAKGFRVGKAVLPKFFLEDVSNEGFDMVMMTRFGRKVGVTNLPRVMVDGFLTDYLGVDAVLGRNLKVVSGYFVGLMEESKADNKVLDKILGEEKFGSGIIGIGSFNKALDQQLCSRCKVVHLVSEVEKRSSKVLPREKYPKPLIFHDGRLAFRPTLLASLVMFLWIPFGFLLSIIRISIAVLLPLNISLPILTFSGMRITQFSKPNSIPTQFEIAPKKPNSSTLYVCNHRTLIDPIYVSMVLGKPLTAVTYSLSRVTELISPIKTVRLTRCKEKDSKLMEKLLNQTDIVVCPEGTTCREPYLLRFSPLFAEMSDEIVPVAIDYCVSMFYGTTASGYKALDPIFLLMNPITNCSIKILDKLPGCFTCRVGGKSKFEVANYVQSKIGKVLGFECTSLTRKDKYIILAGNEGTI
ncbi:probable glycerol-3-phosphate acyltransferase 3 [Ziziphus jujuba]|uniref:Phospholipid/glycerol acyltransferase domain-containing protein n=2 Tax=Ziziphus jujuba TaxID=326968 RepID=A0A978VVT9_ZIZJJ|nr:probable glycerol-3-phosphate acyltransferase 3 [Ziziphus jujuba]KAH7542934.1 hypothetical protein FEM48_Zijuj02G0128100 [Ziziphus jujuba var. spinosa]